MVGLLWEDRCLFLSGLQDRVPFYKAYKDLICGSSGSSFTFTGTWQWKRIRNRGEIAKQATNISIELGSGLLCKNVTTIKTSTGSGWESHGEKSGQGGSICTGMLHKKGSWHSWATWVGMDMRPPTPSPVLVPLPLHWLLFMPGFTAALPSLTSMLALNHNMHDLWLPGYLIAKIKFAFYSLMHNANIFIPGYIYPWMYIL